ncbi:hypothetical protein M0657_012133 [Pyricularia oryzae]|nr:hypothetical protein M0657_012133 [Pyricularia oryzae]
MQFKTIVVSLGLFALHASAKPYCQVELYGKGGMGWVKLSTVHVMPGRLGKFQTTDYTVNFKTDSACKIKFENFEGRIEYEEWKLETSMVDLQT